LGSLNATARAIAFRGFARQIAPPTRPVGYMANGSFQGKLLSVYETKSVSLTHRMNADKFKQINSAYFFLIRANQRNPRLKSVFRQIFSSLRRIEAIAIQNRIQW
jgi:hypothetical protein